MLAADNAHAVGVGIGRAGLWLVSTPEKQLYHMEANYGKVNGQRQKRKEETEKEIRFRPESRPKRWDFFSCIGTRKLTNLLRSLKVDGLDPLSP